jgi:phage FluMu protein Com
MKTIVTQIHTNKCPHCKAVITAVNAETITMNAGLTAAWNGFSYGCPACKAVLGVQINPVTIQKEIISALSKVIRGQ